MREPVCQEESQADREDGQRVEQQALEDAETIALLRLGRGETLRQGGGRIRGGGITGGGRRDNRRGEEGGKGVFIILLFTMCAL